MCATNDYLQCDCSDTVDPSEGWIADGHDGDHGDVHCDDGDVQYGRGHEELKWKRAANPGRILHAQ